MILICSEELDVSTSEVIKYLRKQGKCFFRFNYEGKFVVQNI